MPNKKQITSSDKKTDKKPKAVLLGQNENTKICENMSFAASEAFKLLRANLFFSLPDEKNCKIIGVSGALKGVGKSLTSINLAYSISQTDKKVLLIDGDMRLPTIAKKLSLTQTPGLSNLLVGNGGNREAVQSYTENLDILPSGDTPPNPSELLGSEKMKELLSELSSRYDYIIIDIPPVIHVSDTLVVSKYVNGIIVVLRRNYDKKAELAETIRQLELAKANILGFVFNYSESNDKRKNNIFVDWFRNIKTAITHPLKKREKVIK